ncbi:MAG: cyclase family protein [Gaiellaceae bacterium MAG52_C11]|nr:cyclase family protein [Candidatus Gaiellasilicea maunaloa]
MTTERIWSDEELIALYERVDNAGRWGPDDELGTLNFITAAKRVRAAALVQVGEVLSLAVPIAPRPVPAGPAAVDHRLFYGNDPSNPVHMPPHAGDFLGLDLHQHGLTHLDCLSHMGSHDGRFYNGRRFEDVAQPDGLTHGSIFAQRGGIVSRGVLLDVAAGLGRDWLEPTHAFSATELEAAERYGKLVVESGDVVVIRAGVEAREAVHGPSALGPGPAPDAIEWLHDREVAVYAGDAPEHLTETGARILGLLPQVEPAENATHFPIRLHQIGIPAMGLILLDYCRVEELARRCNELRRHEFLFAAAPLALPGGTGSPVNPLAIL